MAQSDPRLDQRVEGTASREDADARLFVPQIPLYIDARDARMPGHDRLR